MALWLIPLILLGALGPVLWLLPSRQQRDAARLRLSARRSGLGIQLAEPDWPHWLSPRPPVSCAQYYVPRRGRDHWCYWQSEPGLWLNRWREPCDDPRLAAQLAQLPKDVYQIEAGSQLLWIYWGEQGEEADLARVRAALQALA